ncbi:MAG: DinB family protein [Candidatus Limnocylindria bacterium]
MNAAASAATVGLALIDTEWRRWERLIGRIGVDDFTRQLFDGEGGSATWTIRDVLTHIAAWKRNTIRVAQMHEADAGLSLELTPDEVLRIDVNKFNDDVYQRWRNRPVAEAVAEHRSAHAELMAVLRRLPRRRSRRVPRRHGSTRRLGIRGCIVSTLSTRSTRSSRQGLCRGGRRASVRSGRSSFVSCSCRARTAASTE